MIATEKFPGYEEFDPLVPVWCVTPRRPGCIHRFFDTSPISPSGRYLAVFQLPFEDRQPEPGEKGNVCIVDLRTGEDWVAAETCGWEPQMGANINWGASDRQLFFNDVDTDGWRPFAWRLDPLTGERRRMEGTVYHASPDGRWLISANMGTMRKTQPGYGIVIPEANVRRNVGPAVDDGFFITDTKTGRSHLLVSIRDLVTQSCPPVQIDDPEGCEVYGFHSKFSPQGNWLMLSLRWFPAGGEPVWNAFAAGNVDVRFAWVTAPVEGDAMHCAVGPEQWEKGGHHATWFPDGEKISMNLKIDRDEMRFVEVERNGSGLRAMHDRLTGSGHPTLHRDGRFLLTDSYIYEPTAYGDGTVPLRWVDLLTGREQALIRINTETPFQGEDSTLRVDPHPAWDRAWRRVVFNGFVDGTRRVFIADLKALTGN